MIDKNTSEIKQDEDQTTYKNLDDIAEDLPDHAPRFVLLSYPLILVSSRTAASPRAPCIHRSIVFHLRADVNAQSGQRITFHAIRPG